MEEVLKNRYSFPGEREVLLEDDIVKNGKGERKIGEEIEGERLITPTC